MRFFHYTFLLHCLLPFNWPLILCSSSKGYLIRCLVIYLLPVFLFIHILPLSQVHPGFLPCLSSVAVSSNVLSSPLEDPKLSPFHTHCFDLSTSFWQIFICSSNLGSSDNCLYPPSLPQILSVCSVLDSVTYMLTYYIKSESLVCLLGPFADP